MARATVRLPSALRPYAGGEAAVGIELETAGDVAAVLDRLAASHPAIGRRLRDEQGRLRPHVNVFVGSDNIKDLHHLATAVDDGAEVTILPAVSGG